MAPSASEAAAQAGSGNSVVGWTLDRADREALLRRFPAKFRNAVADHVTLKAQASAHGPLPQEAAGEIVGRAEDGRGVEAMVVRIGGTTDRPGGSTYHITWSLADGRRARESNDVIAAQGWVAFDEPIPIALEPAHFR